MDKGLVLGIEKNWKWIWPICLLALYILGPRWDAVRAERWFAKSDGRPLIMAHGGAKELYPENTLVAFDGAAGMGVDVLEMDVSMTSDGILVTIHGPTLQETTNGTGPVMESTYAEIQELDAGYRFSVEEGEHPWRGTGVRHPSLADVLARYRETHLMYLIELKNDGEEGKVAAKKLAALIRRVGVEDRVMVASFSTTTLESFRAASQGRVPTSGSEKELRKMVIPSIFGLDKWWLFPGQVTALQMPIKGAGFDLTQRKLINRAHQHGQAVHYWTIDEPQRMRVLAERGADGLITDRPDLARQVFQELGFRLPAAVDPDMLGEP